MAPTLPRIGFVALLLTGCGRGNASATPPPVSTFVKVAAGKVVVGSRPSESCRRDEPKPQEVAIPDPLEVAAYEVTQREFEERMGYNPAFSSSCQRCPVDSVSWHEAAAYCNRLSADAGLESCYRCKGEKEGTSCKRSAKCTGYRLPAEAEWEYLARGGTSTPTYAGRITSCMSSDEVADRVAWYKANSEGFAHPVGELEPNPWGLYDIAGNVFEWTDDGTDGKRQLLKGGSWYDSAHHLRVASRLAAPVDAHLSYAGFRCVRTRDARPPA